MKDTMKVTMLEKVLFGIVITICFMVYLLVLSMFCFPVFLTAVSLLGYADVFNTIEFTLKQYIVMIPVTIFFSYQIYKLTVGLYLEQKREH